MIGSVKALSIPVVSLCFIMETGRRSNEKQRAPEEGARSHAPRTGLTRAVALPGYPAPVPVFRAEDSTLNGGCPETFRKRDTGESKGRRGGTAS